MDFSMAFPAGPFLRLSRRFLFHTGIRSRVASYIARFSRVYTFRGTYARTYICKSSYVGTTGAFVPPHPSRSCRFPRAHFSVCLTPSLPVLPPLLSSLGSTLSPSFPATESSVRPAACCCCCPAAIGKSLGKAIASPNSTAVRSGSFSAIALPTSRRALLRGSRPSGSGSVSARKPRNPSRASLFPLSQYQRRVASRPFPRGYTRVRSGDTRRKRARPRQRVIKNGKQGKGGVKKGCAWRSDARRALVFSRGAEGKRVNMTA